MNQSKTKKTLEITAGWFVRTGILLLSLLLFSSPAFGQYTASDPGFSWEDISGSGIPVSLNDDDFTAIPVPIGFTFNIFGNNYTDAYICSNGYLSFGTGYTNLSSPTVPDLGNPNNMVAGWLADLYPPVGTIHYQTIGTTPNRRFIVQFTSVGHCCNGTNLSTFEFKLFENNAIEVHYLNTTSNGQDHLVGVENFDGTEGMTWYWDPAPLAPNSAVRFSSASPNTPPITSGIGNVIVNEDAAITNIDLWPSFADTESADNLLTYAVTNNTNPGLFDSYNVTGGQYLDLDYAPDANGTADITVRATDPEMLWVETTFSVAVNAINDPPSFTGGSNQTTNEDAGPQSVAWATGISPGPVGEAGQSLVFNVSNSNPGLFLVQPAISPTGVLAHTPSANANGVATVTVTLQDNAGTANGGADTSAPQSFTITVNPVNDAPTFVKGPDQTTTEGSGPQSVAGWATSISVGPANESAQTYSFFLTNNNPGMFLVQPAINNAGTLAYTLNTDANGVANVTVTLTDSGGVAFGGVNSSTQTFVITVAGINDPPSFVKGPDQTTYEDAGTQIVPNWATSISRGPANEAGQTLTFDLTNDNTGLFSVQPSVDEAGTLTYAAAPDAGGSATVSITLRDNGGTANGGADTSPTQIFVITVDPMNDAPVLDGSAVMALDPIPEDASDAENPGTTIADILASAGFDPITDIDDGAAEGIAVTEVNGNGTWQYDSDATGAFADFPTDLSENRAVLLGLGAVVRFVPEPNFNGTVAPGIVFRAWDLSAGATGGTGVNTLANGGTTAFSTVAASASVTVDPVNDAPVIVESDPVKVAMSEDGSPVDFELSLNATDVDGDPLTWRLAVPPSHGGATTNGTGNSVTVDYTPVLQYNGTDTLIVEVSDGELTDTVTVEITIGAVGDEPVIEEGDNIRVEISEDGDPMPFSLILNASDPDGDSLFWGVFTPASNGTATVTEGPSGVTNVSYVPKPDFDGFDSFVVQVSDGVFTDKIVVAVDIAAVNDAPVIEDGESIEVSMSENGSPSPFALKLNASDPDGDPLTWRVSGAPANGTADVSQTGVVSYTPKAGHSGTDSFTVGVSDGTDTDTIRVQVNIESSSIDLTFTATSERQGLLPLAVSFKYDSSSGITGVLWDFGDGGTSTEANPTHTYEASGSHTVSLTVTGPGGEKTVVKENYVEVLGLRTISGTVTGSDTGKGVGDCAILIWLGDAIEADGITDATGRFTLAQLPMAENYILEILPPDGYKQQFYNGREERGLAERVSTMDGDRDLVIMLEPASRLAIRGWVTGDSDNPGPLAGVRVNAYSETADFGATVTTAADGSYEIRGFEPATDYVVSVSGVGGDYYYSVPAGGTVGASVPTSSAFFWDEATPVTPADPPLANIDIIVGPNQGAWISGTVLSAGEPVSGITVNAWSEALETGSTATTDAQGAYKITGLADVSAGSAGEKGYIVDVWTTGYPYQAFHQADNRDLAALVETGRTDIDFDLKSGYAISGTVKDSGGNPVAGVTVKAWSKSEGDGDETTTDDAGAYAITNLPPYDDYVAAVYPDDYPVRFYNGKASGAEADPIDLAGGNATGVDFTLSKGRVISGKVYAGDTQTPAPAGSVVVVCSESANTCVEAKIDATGAYEITGLDPEVTDYVISVSSPGFQPTEIADPSSAGNLVLETGYTIRGLVEENGMPVSGVRVEACTADKCGFAVTSGNASQGFNYEIGGMPAGTYTIRFESDKFEIQPLSGVSVAGNTENVNASITKGGDRKIAGTIHNLTAGREIFVHARSKTKDASEIVSVIGNGSGEDSYVIENLPAGADFQAEISSDYYAYQAYNGRNDWADADFIDLTEHDAVGVDFTLEETNAVISGSVTFPSEAASGESAKVYAVSASTGAEGSVNVGYVGDATAAYEITDLPSGDDYLVSVWPDTGKKQYYDGVSKEIDATSVETDAGPVDFVLDTGAAISGKVVADDLSDIRVEAWSESLGAGNGTPVSDDGTYMIKGLERAADYVVKAEKPGVPPFFYAKAETAVSESLADPVSTEDGNPDTINLTVSQGESITGTVKDKTGRPLAGIWIDAKSESKRVGSGAFTGDDGTFEIAGLPSGPDYAVTAVPDWSLPYAKQKKTDVSPGDDLKFILNSRIGFTLGGTIRDVRDEHVPNVTVEIRSDALKLFQWSDTDRSGKHDLHVLNRYEFEGLPETADYVLTARPPADSPFAVFVRKGLAVTENADLNIVMEPGVTISGTVHETSGGVETPVVGVRVVASSEETSFLGEAVTDRNGFYKITNAPEAADYVVTARKKGYASKEESELYPGDGMDFLLDAAGSVSGTVKDKATGKPIPNLLVEARSEYMNGVPGFGGMAMTDKNGAYSVGGLRKEYRDMRTGEAVPVDDYVVTVLPEAYPRQSRAGKKPGDTADFMLTNSRANRISGTAFDANGGLPDAIVVDVFENGGDFIKKADVRSDGTFEINGLTEDGLYALRFTAFDSNGEHTQWAGEGDTGFDDPDPTGIANPEDAKIYATGETADFRFSADAFSRRKRSAGPKIGRVRMLRSSTHAESDTMVLGLRSPVAEIVSNDPNVTVLWEPTGEGVEEEYLYVFNKEPEFVIDRRSAPKSPPVRMRSATSGKLLGDDEQFHCHVAAVDRRGRIGDTATIGFRIDTVGPSNLNVKSLESASRQYAKLSLGATGATEVYISNINHGEGGQWENWTKSREWKRMEGGDLGKIYVQFRDRAKNVVNAPVIAEKSKQWQIRATAGTNGRIMPFGNVTVNQGEDAAFDITPDKGFEIAEVLVDGVAVTLENGNRHTFRAVSHDSTISVTFREVWHVITATAGPNGTIDPSGEIRVRKDSELVFAITPDPGYKPLPLLDGSPVLLSKDNRFRFINVNTDYALSVTFVPE